MLFNSLTFAVFFPVVSILFFVLPHRFRWALLLAASCIFYMYFIPIYILILIFTIIVDYIAGIWIENASGRKRKLLLAASIIANVGVLGFFKYFNFLNTNVASIARFLNWNYGINALTLILPVGLSFHTFQAMSYTIEVYRGKQKAERHFGIYALYVMFYPQLVAGPIERPQNLLHQFHEEKFFDANRVVSGLQLMLWGLFKKSVIADRLAPNVGLAFLNPHQKTGPALLVASILFSWQIYCDFSGYTDIALGSARVMGFNLMRNFDRPYMARSVSEFWRRWHISLSTWFKDYVYIPLGGSRVAPYLWTRNLLVVFCLSGLWHGASWTFVIWGLLHGLFIVVGHITKPVRDAGWKKFLPDSFTSRVRPIAQNLITFALVCLAWIFFRANSVSDACYIVTHIFTGWSPVIDTVIHGMHISRVTVGQLVPPFGIIAVLETAQWINARKELPKWLGAQPIWLRWSAYYAMVIAVVFLGTGGAQFIYFQF